ncbi:DUF2155 domain-containing protein [Lichenicola sp.]|uniref:DUF2155 domain-containing protein n=1 Tax=Lichenicola sp. TaxID=2804529 RepID=UPI003AFFEF91
MKRPVGALAVGLVIATAGQIQAAEYIVPPVMPVPTAWQGRSQAVVRVLDKLDAHVETLTLKAGDTVNYKSLSVTVRSCMDRPDGLPHDSGAYLDIQDRRGEVQPFSGWSFTGEPSIGVFESPIYGVQLVACGGDLVAPAAPPLPPPVPPPVGMVLNTPGPSAPAAASDSLSSSDTGTEDGTTGSVDAVSGDPSAAGQAPPPMQSQGSNPGRGVDQPDPVYPAPARTAPQEAPQDPPQDR